MNEYLDILRRWDRRVADPFIFEHLCELLPAWGFRRMNQGTPHDRKLLRDALPWWEYVYKVKSKR